MKRVTEIVQGIHYVGANDRTKRRFEGLWPLPHGVSYNAYLIEDEKTALIDTIDAAFTERLLGNIREVIGEGKVDYLVINHMEPDHSASIHAVRQAYPDITIEDLEALELDIATFVKSDHLSLLDNVNIPMTGALWTDYTKLLDERLVPSNAPLELMVHRAIARVDVYLKRETTKVNSVDVILDPNLTMTAGTIITLDKTYDRTNLVMHTDADGAGTLGTIQTVDPGDFISPKSWRILSGEQAVSQFETTPVCVFYTPERNCLTNNEKLKLSVSIKTPEGTTRSGDLVIKEAKDKAGIVHTVDKVERNHIYKVTVTITANGVTGDVIDWGEQPIYTDF